MAVKRFNPAALTEARGDRRREFLAAVAGVSTETIRRWELGDSEPDASRLAAIADATGKDLEFFFTEESAA